MWSSFTLLTICLALATALPNPQAPSTSSTATPTSTDNASSSSSSGSQPSETPDENTDFPADDFLLYSGGWAEGLVKDKWSKTCDDEAVKNFKDHPDKSWADLGCDEMHNALIFEWWNNRNNTNLPYTEYGKPQTLVLVIDVLQMLTLH